MAAIRTKGVDDIHLRGQEAHRHNNKIPVIMILQIFKNLNQCSLPEIPLVTLAEWRRLERKQNRFRTD